MVTVLLQAGSLGNTGAIAEAGVKNIVDGRMSEKKNMQVSEVIQDRSLMYTKC